jgi:hypothetical protein
MGFTLLSSSTVDGKEAAFFHPVRSLVIGKVSRTIVRAVGHRT